MGPISATVFLATYMSLYQRQISRSVVHAGLLRDLSFTKDINHYQPYLFFVPSQM